MIDPKKYFGDYNDHIGDSMKPNAEPPYLDGGYPGDGRDGTSYTRRVLDSGCVLLTLIPGEPELIQRGRK